MSDQKTKCAPRDASLVNLENDDDVDYWIEKFGVTRDHLVFAVHRVGCPVLKVEEELNPLGRQTRADSSLSAAPSHIRR